MILHNLKARLFDHHHLVDPISTLDNHYTYRRAMNTPHLVIFTKELNVRDNEAIRVDWYLCKQFYCRLFISLHLLIQDRNVRITSYCDILRTVADAMNTSKTKSC